MRETSAISGAINQLEKVQAELAAISTRTDEQRLYDLIDLRRQLAAHIAELGRAAEPWMVALDKPEVMQTYREKFSRMRSAAAMHQANWPAVRLAEADDEYRRSVKTVRESNRDFVSWLRGTIAAA